jgi:hypothetical protein
MSTSASAWIERYCEPNDGYIEVANDPSDDEDEIQPEDVISTMKERARKVGAKKIFPKSRKRSR